MRSEVTNASVAVRSPLQRSSQSSRLSRPLKPSTARERAHLDAVVGFDGLRETRLWPSEAAFGTVCDDELAASTLALRTSTHGGVWLIV